MGLIERSYEVYRSNLNRKIEIENFINYKTCAVEMRRKMC